MARATAEKTRLLEEAIERFKIGDEADGDQRARELLALRFDAGDQWPDWVKRTRQGASPGQADNIGARPMLTIPLLDQPIAQVINQQKTADLGLKIRPKGGTTVHDADVRQGLIRDIQVQSRAKLARNWAFERAVKVGRGFYAVRKARLQDRQHPWDQELRVDLILDQSKVLLDPFHQQPDGSDAEWAFEWSDLPASEFKRKFPKAKLSRANESELVAQAEQTPGWIGGTDGARTYRVADYWYARYEKQTVTLYQALDGAELAVWDGDAIPEGVTPVTDEDGKPDTLVVQRRRIEWCKLTANEILEETAWEGQHLPIIQVVGKEYNLNGVRKWMGIVEPAMDACRLVNYTASAIAEAVATAPKSPLELDPEQIEGYEDYWKQANVRNFPYLPRRAFNERGDPYPDIKRLTSEPPIQAMTILLQQAMGFVQNASQTPASALGQLDPTHRSGKAIKALQERSELANSNYLDNLATISMTYEGIILNEMLPYVYDRPGRVVQILSEEQEVESVILNAPFVQSPDGPLPAPAIPAPGDEIEEYTLSPEGQFGVVIEVGRNFTTKRQEASAALGELIPNLPPEMATALIPDFIRELDFPKSEKMAAKAERALPPALQDPKDGEAPQIPPEVQAQIQQLQMQNQELQQLADKNVTDLKKAAEQSQVELEKARMEIASRERIAQQQAEVKLIDIEAMINAKIAQAMIARETKQDDMRHQIAMADVQQQHALEQGAMQHASALEQQAAKPPNGAGA